MCEWQSNVSYLFSRSYSDLHGGKNIYSELWNNATKGEIEVGSILMMMILGHLLILEELACKKETGSCSCSAATREYEDPGTPN